MKHIRPHAYTGSPYHLPSQRGYIGFAAHWLRCTSSGDPCAHVDASAFIAASSRSQLSVATSEVVRRSQLIVIVMLLLQVLELVLPVLVVTLAMVLVATLALPLALALVLVATLPLKASFHRQRHDSAFSELPSYLQGCASSRA